MSTLISGTSSWLSGAEFCKRNDPRTAADLIGDANLRPYQNTNGTINIALLAADDNLVAALASASGRFESDVFVGGRYTLADLTLIAGTTCNAQAYMFDLIARIARMKIVERRLALDPVMQVPMWYTETVNELKRIREGNAIFGLLEVQQAGQPQAQTMTRRDYEKLHLTSTVARPFFGTRGKDLNRGF